MHATGPRTEEGKKRSSLNALKHGLTGQTLIILKEDREAYESHCRGFLDHFKPIGYHEAILAQSIADDYWRANSGRVLESDHMAKALDGDPGHEKFLSTLSLYIHRIERTIKNNLQTLDALQAQRKQAHRQAEEQAKLLTRAAAANGESYDPAQDFPEVVFSKSQLVELISREDRLMAARAKVGQAVSPADAPQKTMKAA
jgi:hypothetical protein